MNPVSKAVNTRIKAKKKTRQELDLEARERKHQKKHRGNKPGSRSSNLEAGKKLSCHQRKLNDPRIGSKVPVPLIISDKQQTITAIVSASEEERYSSPQEELAVLENDSRLDTLLARLEQGEDLTTEEQGYVDSTLDRIDVLMEMLGIELDDEGDGIEEAPQEDIMQLLKRGNPKDKF